MNTLALLIGLTTISVAMATLEKIDCHAHFVPQFYHDALNESGYSSPDGMPYIPGWSEEDHLTMMSDLNISKAILSISSPGTYLSPGNDSAARSLARRCNEYAGELKQKHPDKFGFWASLPLPDINGSLIEIAYSLETLNADGFMIDTNVFGIYAGDTRFEPIWAELNRRKAKLFMHPTTPCVVASIADNRTTVIDANPLTHYPRPILEFFFDTARAVANLFISGTVQRYPHVTYIVPHAGGALPALIDRFTFMAPALGLTHGGGPNSSIAGFPDFVKERLRKQFYFDTAGWSLPNQIIGLLQYVGPDRLIYGSDYPWSPLTSVQSLSEAHDQYLPQIFPDPDVVRRICSGNAEHLLRKHNHRTGVNGVKL